MNVLFLFATMVGQSTPVVMGNHVAEPFAYVARANRSYRDIEFLRLRGAIAECPPHYFISDPLRTRYEFALVIDRLLHTLKVGRMPLAFPDRVDFGKPFPFPTTLDEIEAAKRLAKEFRPELVRLGDNMDDADTWLKSREDEIKDIIEILKKLPKAGSFPLGK
jgi:hypothetical protein